MTTKTAVITLNSLSCASCGVVFAVTDDWERERRRDHRSFWCPNGHSLSWSGKSDIEEAKAALKWERDQLKWERDRAAALLAERDGARASLRATKGHVTRLRKLAASGECPFGCGRRFAGLTEHIAKVHPEQDLEGE